MIRLTKLNGTTFALNSDLIETIEETPDTIIRLSSKNYFIVQETVDEVIQKIVLYHRDCNNVLDRIRLNREEGLRNT